MFQGKHIKNNYTHYKLFLILFEFFQTIIVLNVHNKLTFIFDLNTVSKLPKTCWEKSRMSYSEPSEFLGSFALGIFPLKVNDE